MKTSKFLFAIAMLGIVFTSCTPVEDIQSTLVDFENVTLNSDSIWNGSDLSGSFVSGNSTFKNSYNASWGAWTGFACSSKKDVVTSGYGNQYSVIAGSGAFKSRKFAIAYDSATISIPKNIDYYTVKYLYITNSTYTYLALKNGSDFNHIFSATGNKGGADWFKVTIKGYKNSVQTGSVDYYLADFRAGKSILVKDWQKVDLSSLGQVDLLTFTFDSTDKSGIYLNNPAYACIDDIAFTQTISTK